MVMKPEVVYERAVAEGVIAVMRGAFNPDVALSVTQTLLDSGISSFEMTMNSDDPIEAMQAVKREYGDEACVGMGTVLDVESAKRVIDAGGDFVVSPAFQPDVVEYVLSQGVSMVPGVITPSEAVAAWAMGPKLLKLFPIGALGVTYFKSLFGPLNHMEFTCNGAVDADSAREFIQAGAKVIGMAGWLTGDGTWPESRIRSRAQILLNAIATGRGESPMLEA